MPAAESAHAGLSAGSTDLGARQSRTFCQQARTASLPQPPSQSQTRPFLRHPDALGPLARHNALDRRDGYFSAVDLARLLHGLFVVVGDPVGYVAVLDGVLPCLEQRHVDPGVAVGMRKRLSVDRQALRRGRHLGKEKKTGKGWREAAVCL